MSSEPYQLLRSRSNLLSLALESDLSSLSELNSEAEPIKKWFKDVSEYIAKKTKNKEFVNIDKILNSFFKRKEKFLSFADKLESINGFSAFKNELNAAFPIFNKLYNNEPIIDVPEEQPKEPSFSQDEIVTKAESFLSKALRKDSETKLLNVLRRKPII